MCVCVCVCVRVRVRVYGNHCWGILNTYLYYVCLYFCFKITHRNRNN